MTLPANGLPYGLRDVKLTPRDSVTGAYSTFVDLPASRTMSWEESEDFEELKGDDITQASRGDGPDIDWDLEQGGISLEALAVLGGGTVVETGVHPNIVRTFTKLGTTARPWFRVDGKAISDNSGDVHVTLYKCKAEGGIGGSFEEGSFHMNESSGKAYPDKERGDELYSIVHNETEAAILQPV